MIEESILVVQIVTLGYYANLSTGVATGVAVGMGRPEYEMRFGVLLGILSAALSIGLVQTIGFFGPAIAISISLTISAVYFYKLFHGFLGRPLGTFMRSMYSIPLTAGGIAATVILGLQAVLLPAVDSHSRIVSFSVLCGEGVLFVGLYVFMVMRTTYLDSYDRALFGRYLAKITP